MLHIEKDPRAEIFTVQNDDGGLVTIGRYEDMIDAGALDEGDLMELEPGKWVVIDMVEIYPAESFEAALARVLTGMEEATQ